jgi:hypothetical protein
MSRLGSGTIKRPVLQAWGVSTPVGSGLAATAWSAAAS